MAKSVTNHEGIEFNVGDVVGIHKPTSFSNGSLGTWENVWLPSMDNFIGHVGVITAIDERGIIVDDEWGWPVEAVALIHKVENHEKPEEKMTEKFPKLENFQRVVLRNGGRYLVVTDSTGAQILHNGLEWTGACFDSDSKDEFEIVAVYKMPTERKDIINPYRRGPLIWGSGKFRIDVLKEEIAKLQTELQHLEEA